MTERYSFEESTDLIPGKEKQVKLDPRKSRFASRFEAQQAAKQLETRATEIHQKTQNRQQEIYNLGSQFLEIFKDRTLVPNKGPTSVSVEREVLQKLIQFATEVNIDLDEKEGMGSVSLLTLLLKVLLLARDRSNVLDHKVHQLENRVLQLEKKLLVTMPSPTLEPE